MMINKPVNLTFSPEEIAIVLDTLAQAPYGRVSALMDSIFKQMKPQTVPPTGDSNEHPNASH